MNNHLNLFYSYQTHHLENNVTRSFIVTLKNLSPIHVRLFLRHLCFNKPNEKHWEFLQKLDPLAEANLSFDLQAASLPEDEKLTAKDGRIIGINYSGSQALQFDPSVIENAGASPDASLTDDGCGIMIAFEAKLADTLYREQLQRHHRKLFDPNQTPLDTVFIQTTWNEIVVRLDQISKLTDNPKERFLISEFIDYLELLGLVADFRGFQTSDIKSNNFQKLHKFLLCVSKQISDSELREYNGDQKLFFKDVLHSNLWIEFAEEALTCTIVRGEFSFPRDYDRFYQTITDTTLNSCKWITKHQIMERFTDEIREHGGDLDSQGMFPNLDTDSLLQYCYLSVEVGIPERRLVATSVSNLVEFFRSLLGQLHRAMLKIDEAVYPGPASE